MDDTVEINHVVRFDSWIYVRKKVYDRRMIPSTMNQIMFGTGKHRIALVVQCVVWNGTIPEMHCASEGWVRDDELIAAGFTKEPYNAR